ncbi:MAG TPA: hypothetical protein VGH33_06640 [Isosphaeraceae bacterium]|jgi:predicted CopG family antitoxin
MRTQITITFSAAPDEVEEYKRLAKEQRLSFSAFVRNLFEDYKRKTERVGPECWDQGQDRRKVKNF